MKSVKLSDMHHTAPIKGRTDSEGLIWRLLFVTASLMDFFIIIE